MNSDGYFFVKDENQIPDLAAWLKRREYNSMRSDLYDTRKQPMIGLAFRDESGMDKRGVIVFASEALRDKGRDIAEKAVTQ